MINSESNENTDSVPEEFGVSLIPWERGGRNILRSLYETMVLIFRHPRDSFQDRDSGVPRFAPLLYAVVLSVLGFSLMIVCESDLVYGRFRPVDEILRAYRKGRIQLVLSLPLITIAVIYIASAYCQGCLWLRYGRLEFVRTMRVVAYFIGNTNLIVVLLGFFLILEYVLLELFSQRLSANGYFYKVGIAPWVPTFYFTMIVLISAYWFVRGCASALASTYGISKGIVIYLTVAVVFSFNLIAIWYQISYIELFADIKFQNLIKSFLTISSS